MFGLGMGEILLIAVLAIVVLGPDKLPTAMVEVAKFFKSFKKTVSDAKGAIDSELNLTELKDSADAYKKSLEHTREELTKSMGAEAAEKEMANLKNMLDTNVADVVSTPTTPSTPTASSESTTAKAEPTKTDSTQTKES
jgi:sec-independent protein translocase protein TatB